MPLPGKFGLIRRLTAKIDLSDPLQRRWPSSLSVLCQGAQKAWSASQRSVPEHHPRHYFRLHFLGVDKVRSAAVQILLVACWTNYIQAHLTPLSRRLWSRLTCHTECQSWSTASEDGRCFRSGRGACRLRLPGRPI